MIPIVANYYFNQKPSENTEKKPLLYSAQPRDSNPNLFYNLDQDLREYSASSMDDLKNI